MRSVCPLVGRMTRCCGFLLILSLFLLRGDCSYTTHVHISAGHAFVLNCDLSYDDEVENVTWTREPNQTWDDEMKVIDQSLWFFPARESHSGNYSCSTENNDVALDRVSEKHFSVSVAHAECPSVTSLVPVVKSRYSQLFCHGHVVMKTLKLASISILSWTWMKDCRPLSWTSNSDKLQFQRVAERDGGVYTCMMNFTLNGTSYTVAESKKVLVIEPVPVPQKPRIVKPQQETLAVKRGSKQVLNCKAFVGPGSCHTNHVEPTNPFWLLDGQFIQTKPDEVSVDDYCTTENRVEYRHSNLTIFKMQDEYFNVPLQCVVHNSIGHDNGTVVLIPSRENELYVGVAVFSAVAVLALLCYLFRVDLVLAYRRLSPCVKQPNDGKLYDAYVTYPHSDDHSVSFATTFALRILPEVLEDRFGYKLFISERDAQPGTAVPDVVSETIAKSRRMIVVLTPETFTNMTENEAGHLDELLPERSSLNNNITASKSEPNPNWGPYECRLGLYDALVKECLKVILVQVGGDVDEALLPESLRYVKRNQGILKWKHHYKNKPNGTFWKQMQYRMPPVRKARPDLVV